MELKGQEGATAAKGQRGSKGHRAWVLVFCVLNSEHIGPHGAYTGVHAHTHARTHTQPQR